jgi:hypothetical protein
MQMEIQLCRKHLDLDLSRLKLLLVRMNGINRKVLIEIRQKWLKQEVKNYALKSTYSVLYIIYYYYGSTALCRALPAFSVSWSYTQSVGLLRRGITPLQGLYLRTEQQKHRIKTHNTDINSLSGIRTHDPSVRASEDMPCLRPRGHYDRPLFLYGIRNNCLSSGRSLLLLLLYLFKRMLLQLTAVIIEERHYYQLHTQFYLLFSVEIN